MEILFDFKSLGWEACMHCAAMSFTTLSLGEIKRKNNLMCYISSCMRLIWEKNHNFVNSVMRCLCTMNTCRWNLKAITTVFIKIEVYRGLFLINLFQRWLRNVQVWLKIRINSECKSLETQKYLNNGMQSVYKYLLRLIWNLQVTF